MVGELLREIMAVKGLKQLTAAMTPALYNVAVEC
jgi:hypothetical protein